MTTSTEALAIPTGGTTIETRGIERVEQQDRHHHRVWELGTLWFSANFVLSTVVTGALAIPVFRLGLVDSLLAIVIFNALGIFPVAFFCTLGPRLGLRQMTISRFAFGWRGGQLTALFNMAACIGWGTVNVIIGGNLFASVSGLPYVLCVIIIAGLTTLISIYGYRTVHHYERFAWIPLAATFLIMAVVAAPHASAVPTPAFTLAFVASWISFGGAILGFAIGWSSYAADYSTYLPEDTSPASVFWWTFVGEFLACLLLEAFGVVLSSWMPNTFGTDLLVGNVKSLGSFGSLLLLLIVASVVSNNIPNDYSLGLTSQVLGEWWRSIPRWMLTLAGAIVYTTVALILGSHVEETLTNFLLLMAYWLGPWSVILLIEHFRFRKGVYNVQDWDTPSKLPLGWAAVVSFIIGLVGVVLGANQVYFEGPVARAFGGMDLGFELGVVFALIAYLALRPRELQSTPDRAPAQTDVLASA
ncbi:MAG TPA: cytosine permease [Chloroflexota bacterium]|nr:cytosine permease [Chloroflexota bacterium]